jgi:hypothetical protein
MIDSRYAAHRLAMIVRDEYHVDRRSEAGVKEAAAAERRAAAKETRPLSAQGHKDAETKKMYVTQWEFRRGFSSYHPFKKPSLPWPPRLVVSPPAGGYCWSCG